MKQSDFQLGWVILSDKKVEQRLYARIDQNFAVVLAKKRHTARVYPLRRIFNERHEAEKALGTGFRPGWVVLKNNRENSSGGYLWVFPVYYYVRTGEFALQDPKQFSEEWRQCYTNRRTDKSEVYLEAPGWTHDCLFFESQKKAEKVYRQMARQIVEAKQKRLRDYSRSMEQLQTEIAHFKAISDLTGSVESDTRNEWTQPSCSSSIGSPVAAPVDTDSL